LENKFPSSQIRHHLGKTQKQLAQLLGTSLQAKQSFEQGWRDISVHAERQLVFLLALKRSHGKRGRSCWVMRKYPIGDKAKLPRMGISRREPLLVYQWYNLSWQGSEKLEREDEPLPTM
jgi:DNA-binding XRE family transcriptional regulator